MIEADGWETVYCSPPLGDGRRGHNHRLGSGWLVGCAVCERIVDDIVRRDPTYVRAQLLWPRPEGE